MMHRFRLIGFNSRTYDIPMLLVALQGVGSYKLKEISDEIILQDMQAYEVERKYNVRAPYINHIDLIEVAPIDASLKIYGGRLHCERMQDLPYSPHEHLEPWQASNVRDYNINDLDVTHDLFDHIKPFIEMRETLGAEYNIDLRSKSDAQVAEAIISKELDNIGIRPRKPEVDFNATFNYNPPEWVSFQTPQLKELLYLLSITEFEIGGSGKPRFPHSLYHFVSSTGLKVVKKEKDGKKSYAIALNLFGNAYTMAMGGLHSSEESVWYKADDETYIIDRDVASFYPFLILNNRFFPPQIGEAFLEIFNGLVQRRLKLKKEKNPLEAGLKIAINGTFGKLGNMYSIVYAPDMLMHVTITGQLALLMLIEMIELVGIPIVSANTDGIVIKCPKSRYEDLENVIIQWEARTGLVTEETRYSAIYSRDVNNYIAIKELKPGENQPEIKSKGAYSERGSAQNSVLSKNPESLICSDAVQQYLANGVPIEQTIYDCTDIRRFVNVRTVKGGAEKDGVYLGKAVRWYYATNETGTINYAMSGNKVPKSEGAKPLMILPTSLPDDLNHQHYIDNAIEILYEVGVLKRAAVGKLI